ncbi:DUF4381 domain-containing protein [Pseudomonas rubra]|uniref:DUF4381 domain-containing protein n=1 Tax=Pseudomonas rubra TaxID=2942627 RepID=A0ABT5P6U9_9PSED|nr:DUF4381 domain-containing protein [Pseudomonas rubra]MDD1013896.1 DUF4381 domain-containing protein [Pseudomonas rubra]MDD1038283.1 DUF4381 domain-containing protein [Pseudomonas rubra]MDD1154627.1 DUF4381 domain-containing protein [Pseudomonas rubra]
MTTPVQPAIDQLQELASGAPPFSYWPQTWAWGAVLVVLVLSLGAWGAWRWRQWRRDRYRRQALLRLDQLRAMPAEKRLAALRELPELLKRVALSMPGAPPVASLGGASWQTFLAAHAPHPLPAGFAFDLQQVAYAPDAQLQALDEAAVAALFTTSRRWIETHHVAV